MGVEATRQADPVVTLAPAIPLEDQAATSPVILLAANPVILLAVSQVHRSLVIPVARAIILLEASHLQRANLGIRPVRASPIRLAQTNQHPRATAIRRLRDLVALPALAFLRI